jgi:predicted aldo/keto reductase-like oxidoreductase
MKRRDFLGTTLAGMVAAHSTGTHLAYGLEASKQISDKEPFARVPLGKSGLVVSRVGMGSGMRGWQRRSNQTRLGDEAFHALWRYGFDQGINYFDMADLYGSHSDVMPALKGVPRDQFVLVSKIWWREGGLPEQERLPADVLVERFLKEIGTDYIDLVHLHCVVDPDWHHKLEKQMELLDKVKQQGKIRAHGVSVHSLVALGVAAEHPWVDCVHTRINPYGVKMDGKPEEVVPILRKMHDNGKGITGMKIVGEGEFRDDPEKRDQSIRFFLNSGCVDACIVGFEKATEVDDFRNRVRKTLEG